VKLDREKAMKTFAERVRSGSIKGRAPLAFLVMAVVLATATGAALAQDNSGPQSAAAESSTSTSDPTTSTSDPTTSTSDPTTSTSDPTTTSEETTTSTSEELADTSDATTTTSALLNAASVPEARATTCTKIEPVTADQTATVTVGNPNDVTLTFTFNDAGGGEANSATWSSSAPFTGDIIVKAGSAQSGGGEITYSYVNATTGTISSPFTNQNGQTFAISHVEICGERGNTTTPPTTTTTTTTTPPPTTTTTTVTPPAGTTPGGGVGGTTGGGKAAGKKAGGGPVAAQPAPAESGLAFTGFYAPLMVLVAMAMGAAGLALRRRLNGSA
jgi:hypothetical protein